MRKRMTIPKHIRKMTERVEIELEKQLKVTFNEELTKDLEKIRKVRSQLSTQKGELFSDKDDYMNSISIVKAIKDSCYELSADAIDRIFKEVRIEPELSFALNHSRFTHIHPSIIEEIEAVNQLLEDVPISSWAQIDSFDDFKVFKLVTTKEEWEEIIEKNSGENLGIGMSSMPDFKFVKIGYVKSTTSSHNLEGTAQKAKEYLVGKLGEEGFEKIREDFELWFKIGTVGTYYIYVPK